LETADLKVLIIWDIASVASTLYTELKKLGVESRIIFRHSESPWGDSPYVTYWDYPKIVLGARLILEAGNYDIIHLNSKDYFLPFLRYAYPWKPILMHYHGTDIRERWEEKRHLWKHADRVLVSTKGLLDGAPSSVEWLPNPIDRKKFPSGPVGCGCVHFSHGCDEEARELAKRYGLELTILPRTVPREDMPYTLCRFSHIIPLKYEPGKGLLCYCREQRSVTELEALSLGLSTVKVSGIYSGFPPEHDSSVVAKRLYEIYKQMLGEVK
jgi:hypothetical protein